MTTDNIFGNNILSGDLNTSLVPELGTEDISLTITPIESSFINPLSQELSLTEQEIILDEKDNGNNSFKNFSPSNNFVFSNIDPFIGGDVKEFQVNNVSASNASFTSSQSQLEFQGRFGDYDGRNDVTFKVKNEDGAVVETYSLKGEGQATLHRDSEDGKAYISFSGTNKNTSVEISAKSNIQFGSYIGDSLKIETTGSIDAESVILNNPDGIGLVLKSGVIGSEETLDVAGYEHEIVSLGAGDVKGINNNGDVLVEQTAHQSFIYSDGEIEYIGYGENLVGVRGINDSRQVVGYTDFPDGRHAFVYSNGSMSDLGVLPKARPSEHSRSLAEDINNSGQIVGWSSSDDKYNAPYVAFSSNGGSMSDLHSGLVSSFGSDTNRIFESNAVAINDSGKIVGSYTDSSSYGKAFVGGSSQNKNLHSLLGEGVKSSGAIDINNEGQVIGLFQYSNVSYSGTNRQPSFIYDDGNVNILRNLELSDINNNGEAVGFGSIENENGLVEGAILYDVNEDSGINLNKYFYNSEDFIFGTPKFINDRGQIAGYGQYDGTRAIYLITPQFVEPELDKYISIGNISTFGDTVLLQGNEITFSGNKIKTKGGDITFDGATTVNSNLTINTSVIEDEVITDGGDITFTGTLDSSSAGASNLRLQSGTGNILFRETVGSEATLENINVLGADIVTATADITSDQLVRINATGDIVTQNLTSDNGRVVVSSQEKSISTLDIASGSEEGDNIILQAGDSISAVNLSGSESGVVKLVSGTYLEEDSSIVGNITTASITGKRLEVESSGSFTAEADILTNDGNVVVDAKQDITVENITANNGNVKLTSEEKSITTLDISTVIPEAVTDEETTRKGNIVLEAIEGVNAGNLDANESGVVRITSGKVEDNDTETLEDDTVVVGDISTQSITGKAVRAVGTGSFTTTEDITAHDGRITVAVTNDLNTKSINSLAKSINLISTKGAVTVDGDLNSEKGGVAIHAANNIETQKIRSLDGAVALSSYDGQVFVGDDINTVRGGVTIAAKEGVEVAKITTGVGEVNIGSGKSIVASGNISTNVGYVNLKAGGSLNLQSVITNNGYISLGADSNVEVSSLTTNSGAINLVSATGSVAAGSIDTEGSYVAIEAALEIIASAIEARGGGKNLVANSDFGGLGLIATDPDTVTDVNAGVIDDLESLSPEQGGLFSEIVSDVVYHSRPVGEFLIGALYATIDNNVGDTVDAVQFLLQYPLALTDRDRKYWTQVINNQSTAFKLGIEVANAASIVQGIIEIVAGGGTFLGGAALCTVGAGATFGISCGAGAPAMVTGAAISAHGLSLIKNGLENDTDANLIDDLLAPQKMESTGGADAARGIAQKIGASPDRVENALEVLGSKKIEQLEGRLNFTEIRRQRDASGQLVEYEQDVKLLNLVLDKSKELVYNISKAFDQVDDNARGIQDIDGISDLRKTIKQNKVRNDGSQRITDQELNIALIENNNFWGQYQGRVSGAYANRFGRANASKLDDIQARGELNTAKDVLDGNTVLGDNVKVRGIFEKTNQTKNPEFLATMSDGSTRIVEVKTLTGKVERNLGGRLRNAISQIEGHISVVNPTNNGYIRLDYRNSPPTRRQSNWWQRQVDTVLQEDIEDPTQGVGTKGIDVVEFVEILYKDDTGQIQNLLMQVQNGNANLM